MEFVMLRKKAKKKKKQMSLPVWPLYVDTADVISQQELRETADRRRGERVLRKPLELACCD